jgi:hypothetical protein
MRVFLRSPGCEYGFGDASIYFGTQVDSSLELANVDGIFFSFTSETFIAEDPSVAVSGAGSASFTVRFVNDNYRKFASFCLLDTIYVSRRMVTNQLVLASNGKSMEHPNPQR